MKKSIFALFLSAAAMACAGDFFVSKDGGVWGEAFAWEKNAVPSAPVNLRMSQNSGNLQVDGDRTVQTISVWGKAQNIHLLENSVFMLGSGGFNPQNSSVCVSGSGFFRCAGDNLKVYGGDGGVVNFVSNVELDSIVFDNSRKILKSAKIAMRQPIDRIFKTRAGKDGVYAPLKIAGAKGADCSVSLEGNTTVGDIEVRSNARLTVATDRLFLSGKYKKAEVFDATLELVRKAAPYRFGAKVRLNGGERFVLERNYKFGCCRRRFASRRFLHCRRRRCGRKGFADCSAEKIEGRCADARAHCLEPVEQGVFGFRHAFGYARRQEHRRCFDCH